MAKCNRNGKLQVHYEWVRRNRPFSLVRSVKIISWSQDFENFGESTVGLDHKTRDYKKEDNSSNRYQLYLMGRVKRYFFSFPLIWSKDFIRIEVVIDKVIDDDEFQADFEASLSKPIKTVAEVFAFDKSTNQKREIFSCKNITNKLILCHDMKGGYNHDARIGFCS